MSSFTHIKEVINQMQKYDLFEVTIRGRIVSFDWDNSWKNKEGKEYVFNTMYIRCAKPSDINPRAYDVALTEEQATEIKKDETKYVGKDVTLVCEARRSKTGGYRFYLLNFVK